MTVLDLIGVASCVGAQDQRCALGPERLVEMQLQTRLSSDTLQAQWKEMIYPELAANLTPLKRITQVCDTLSELTYGSILDGHQFAVFGGDHSCAIGTWSGVVDAVGPSQPLGLLWIDAHLDSHLPETSQSGAIHGMPLACLLGHGEKSLRALRTGANKLLPKNVCVIGARSFEVGEATLLELLGVRVYFMDEVKQRGLLSVFNEAWHYLRQHTANIGVTVDLDAIDPIDAPGVGSPVSDGLCGEALIQALQMLRDEPQFIGLEVTELNPALDQQHTTAELAIRLLKSIYS